RNLSNLLTEYNKTRPSNNGVWISGFFGSGKSHLLKILALLLENRRWDGFSIADVLHDKLPTSDAMLRAEIRKVTQIPAKSILFNIDQKAPIVNADEFNAVLSVFSRVFDEFCGYYGNQGYVANFERELDHQGCYQSFK